MRELTTKHRFWLGLVVLGFGISTIGTWNPSPRGNSRTVSTALQDTQTPHRSLEKYVGKYASYSNEPVIITDLKIKGRPTQINSSVAEEEDWLNGLTFKIGNISKKKIVFIYVEMLFPETKIVLGNPFAFDLRYGADPRLNDTPATEQPVEPGKEAEFVVSGESYQKLKRIIETRITPIRNINSVQINILRVVFDDETAWATGSFMHRDPNNPKRWIDN